MRFWTSTCLPRSTWSQRNSCSALSRDTTPLGNHAGKRCVKQQRPPLGASRLRLLQFSKSNCNAADFKSATVMRMCKQLGSCGPALRIIRSSEAARLHASVICHI
ncbi:uncharacterized protein LOC144206579 [Stigmatopora nigra]